MEKQIPATSNDMGTRAEGARALMAATTDVAEEKAREARKRLAAALARKSMAVLVRRRSKESKPRTRPCTNILIKLSGSPSVWGVSSLIWSRAGARALAGD